MVVSIRVTNPADAARDVEAALTAGADAIELRIDGFDGDLASINTLLKRYHQCVWIVTCRSSDEGGRFDGDATERTARLAAAARDTGAYIDFELADWRLSGDIRQKIGAAAVEHDADRPRLILSTHRSDGHAPNVRAILDEVAGLDSTAVVKVAWEPADIRDNFVALDAMRSTDVAGSGVAGVIAICTGEEGIASRVLAPKFGAWATFCALSGEGTTAPGQVPLAKMKDLYRWDAIDRSTRVYGVIGDPVAHSMGPLLHNRLFQEYGINALYLPFPVAGDEVLRGFIRGVMERPWLDVGGFSVTIPHKSLALALTDECPDPAVRRIGAVNTLVVRDGRLLGYNTDAPAAVEALTDALDCRPADLAGLTVNVLGVGGAARAVAAALVECRANVTVYGRSAERTARFAADLDCDAAAWDDRVRAAGDVLINATSVGLWPGADASPIPADALPGYRLVFDLVYNPPRTRLVRDALAARCRTLCGLDMFVRQAAMQFELWTGRSADLRLMRNIVETSLQNRQASRP